jgi:DNA-binding LytR/AlgR family response regulator
MINCLIVDDEPLALDLLEDNISRVPFLNLKGRCQDAFQAQEALTQEKIDLVFMDIQMPGLSGIDCLRVLHAAPMFIFVTAYDKYALEGFNLNAVDYLLKPVSFERFLKATNKALELFTLRHQSISSIPTANHNFIFVNADYSLQKIKLDEIIYVEGLKDYIKIYLSTATRPVVTRMSLKTIEEKLSSGQFMRIHKSFIVAIDKIVSIRKGRVSLGSVDVPISDHYKQDFQRLVDFNSIS